MSLTTATLLIFVATLALAVVTVITLVVTVRRDDRLRREERDRDDQLRSQQQARDDRLRREAAKEAERRERAGQIAREDYEARQVLVTVEIEDHPGLGYDFNRRVTLSTPHAYPVKQVEGCVALSDNGTFTIIGFGHGGEEPYVDEQRIYYAFWAELPERAPRAAPVMRFVDWHGNRYYQYRHYTERFGQNTDWAEVVRKIDEWIRTGPKSD